MNTNRARRFSRLAAGTALGMVGCGLSVPRAQAASYVVTLEQEGSDVVATGAGAIDLAGLTFQTSFGQAPLAKVVPNISNVDTGQGPDDVYLAASINGPANFGAGGFTFASSTVGDAAGFLLSGGMNSQVDVPHAYVSGQLLSDSATYSNQTFASLGLTPGVYEWSWGPGAQQNFTVVVESVPEPASWVAGILSSATLLRALGRKRRT